MQISDTQISWEPLGSRKLDLSCSKLVPFVPRKPAAAEELFEWPMCRRTEITKPWCWQSGIRKVLSRSSWHVGVSDHRVSQDSVHCSAADISSVPIRSGKCLGSFRRAEQKPDFNWKKNLWQATSINKTRVLALPSQDSYSDILQAI